MEEPQTDNDMAVSIATNLNHAENGTLFQTVIAMVFKFKRKLDNCVILFDTGSQRSFISAKLWKKLNLLTIGKESFYIKVFGKSEFMLQ